MDDEIVERLTPIFRETLDDETLVLTPELNASLVENWDSLNHINLIVAIEQEFAMEFSTDDLLKMNRVGDLIELLKARASR